MFADAPGPVNILTDIDYNLEPASVATYRSRFGLGGVAIASGGTYTLNSIVGNPPGDYPLFHEWVLLGSVSDGTPFNVIHSTV